MATLISLASLWQLSNHVMYHDHMVDIRSWWQSFIKVKIVLSIIACTCSMIMDRPMYQF